MNLSRLFAITKKEFKHILRDPRMLLILLMFPAFLLIIFGYAVNFDVSNIKLAVRDNDRTELSRDFANSVLSSSYFVRAGVIKNDITVSKVLDEGAAQCIMVIPEDFSKSFYTRKTVKVQFLIEGVNSNTASIIQSYVTAATNSFNQAKVRDVISRMGAKSYLPLDIRPVFWFNPELKSTNFLLPGLIGMILIVTAVVSVSLSLVREKEKSTIEQINVSPISIPELLIGKAFPYFLLSFLNTGFVLFAGYLFFGIAVKGSFLLFIFCTIIFLIAAVSMGIFISVLADSQQVAFMISTFATLLPSVMLSGFIFPIESMPFLIRVLTNITPVKFYIFILRAIVLRGAGITTFLPQLLYLCLFAVFFLLLASLVYFKQQKKL